MKKILINENQLNAIQQFINEDDSGKRFKFNVTVSIYYKGKLSEYIDDITAPSIPLTYLIESEYREWGIKDISLYSINGPEEIEIEVIFYPEGINDPQTKRIKLPLNWDDLEKETETGMGVVRVGDELTINVTENENNDLHVTSMSIPVYTL